MFFSIHIYVPRILSTHYIRLSISIYFAQIHSQIFSRKFIFLLTPIRTNVSFIILYFQKLNVFPKMDNSDDFDYSFKYLIQNLSSVFPIFHERTSNTIQCVDYCFEPQRDFFCFSVFLIQINKSSNLRKSPFPSVGSDYE